MSENIQPKGTEDFEGVPRDTFCREGAQLWDKEGLGKMSIDSWRGEKLCS